MQPEKEIPGVEPTVPAELVELFRKVFALCKEAGCYGVDLKVKPPWEGGYWGRVSSQWTRGRHGEAATCHVSMETRTRIEV